MRRSLSVAAVAATLASCAPAQPESAPSPSPERTVATTRYGDVVRSSTAAAPSTSINAAPDLVWRALGDAYANLGVEVMTLDRPNGRMGNLKFVAPRSFKGTPNAAMSTYFNCGSTMTGALADQGRITASLISEIKPDGNGGTRLQTAFTGSARRRDGTSADAVDCATTGQLEDWISKFVTLRVAELR